MQIKGDYAGPGFYSHIRDKGLQRFETLEEVASHYGTDLVLNSEGKAKVDRLSDWSPQELAEPARLRETTPVRQNPGFLSKLMGVAGLAAWTACAWAAHLPPLQAIPGAPLAAALVGTLSAFALATPCLSIALVNSSVDNRAFLNDYEAKKLEQRMEKPKLESTGELAALAVLEGGKVETYLVCNHPAWRQSLPDRLSPPRV